MNGPRKVPMTRTQTQHIEDERRVKRPSSAWTHFFSERVKSTDFKGIALQEKSRLIADEWRALSGDEKQVSSPPLPPYLAIQTRHSS